MTDFDVRGADEFLRLSKALKNAGRTELRKELNKGLRDGAKPLIPKAQQALTAVLPSGIAARGRRTKMAVVVKTGRDPGVTIGKRFNSRGTGVGHSNAKLLNDRGLLRHPTFGNREVWRNTSVPAARGWFDGTMRREAPSVRPELEAAIERVARRVVNEAR